jgi:serine/threonine protein kinase
MKKLNKTICGQCNAVLDVSDLEPLTPFKCPGCENELYSPGVIGHLRFDCPLGRKGCFYAYDGFDAKNNVYITILCNDFLFCKDCVAKDIRAAAEKEVLLLMDLNHPNICPLSGYWDIDSCFLIGSPWMDGFEFSDYNPETHDFLNIDLILDVLQKVAVGLASAHHKGILHHNVCPANIHMDLRGNVRIKNFFISRFLDKNCKHNSWKNDFTPYQYMSPEKIEAGKEEKFGDVFSFAVMSYFLLTGKYPFKGECREEEVFSRIMTTDNAMKMGANSRFTYKRPMRPSQLRKDIPEMISEIIMNMLSYSQIKRPQFAEFISAVNTYKADIEKDEIYGAQWNMVVTDTDTKPIPKMDKLGPIEEKSQKDESRKGSVFSINTFFDKKGRTHNE